MENKDISQLDQHYKNLRITEDMWLSTVRIDEENGDNEDSR